MLSLLRLFFSLIFGVCVAFNQNGKLQVTGESLAKDSVMGNLNFFKSVEGFIESLPQSTYQLSIMMRTPWEDISKNWNYYGQNISGELIMLMVKLAIHWLQSLFLGTNQILSVAMSVFTLSNTAATYLFYQHREYISFDERLRKRYRGLNDPPLINTMLCTLLYVMITAPLAP